MTYEDYKEISHKTYLLLEESQQKEIERLKWHIVMIKEAIDTWNIEYREGYVDFEIPKKIIDIVWSDKE